MTNFKTDNLKKKETQSFYKMKAIGNKKVKKRHQSLYSRPSELTKTYLSMEEKLDKMAFGESDFQINTTSDSYIIEKKEINILFSNNFNIVFLVSAARTCSNLLMGSLFKEIGLSLLNNDRFLTIIGIAGILINIFTRFSISHLHKFFGLKLMYFLNLLIEILSLLFLAFLGKNKIGFCVFFALNKISCGKLAFVSN